MSRNAAWTAARMTAFSPGALPPPVLMAIRLMLFMVVRSKWFGAPNLSGVLANGAVAGEPAGCGEV